MATVTMPHETIGVVSQQQQQHQQHQQHQHSIQLLHRGVIDGGLPHGLGLLTTVASLPPKYRSRYLTINTKCETPLDLSVKPVSPQIANDVPIATSFTEVYTEPNSNDCCGEQINNEEIEYTTLMNAAYSDEPAMATATAATTTIDVAETVVIATTATVPAAATTIPDDIPIKAPMTPPPTPTKRKLITLDESMANDGNIEPAVIVERIIAERYVANPTKMAKTTDNPTIQRDTTPVKPIRASDSAPKTNKSQPAVTKSSKHKAMRKLKFDEETSSPVSGTIIRPLEDITDGTIQYSNGDIDPKYNIVEITEETKAELAAIKNVIGDYICKLCRLKFDDAFGLAQHRCACIVLLEYRCPECGKQFNCPANLASHRRWHKPKKDGIGVTASASVAKKENRNTTNTNATKTTAIAATTTTTTRAPRYTSDKLSTATTFACTDCGKQFKRQAYLKKHQLTHGEVSDDRKRKPQQKAANTNSEAAVGITGNIYQSFGGSISSSSTSSMAASSHLSSSSSSTSSLHSYCGASVASGHGADDAGATERVGVGGGTVRYVVNSAAHYNSNYDYDDGVDSMSDCSNTSSTGYGRLQIVESGLTEEENIAAAALTNLRNCASVIQHTTLAH